MCFKASELDGAVHHVGECWWLLKNQQCLETSHWFSAQYSTSRMHEVSKNLFPFFFFQASSCSAVNNTSVPGLLTGEGGRKLAGMDLSRSFCSATMKGSFKCSEAKAEGGRRDRGVRPLCVCEQPEVTAVDAQLILAFPFQASDSLKAHLSMHHCEGPWVWLFFKKVRMWWLS